MQIVHEVMQSKNELTFSFQTMSSFILLFLNKRLPFTSSWTTVSCYQKYQTVTARVLFELFFEHFSGCQFLFGVISVGVSYTCQLFVIHRRDIFILRVSRFFVGTDNIRRCPTISKDVRRFPKKFRFMAS